MNSGDYFRLCRDNYVLSASLADIEPLVDLGDQIVKPQMRGRKLCTSRYLLAVIDDLVPAHKPKRHTYLNVSLVLSNAQRADHILDLAYAPEAVLAAAAHYNEHLLAAPAACHLFGSGFLKNNVRHRLKHPVAAFMTVCIIDFLEVVQITENNAIMVAALQASRKTSRDCGDWRARSARHESQYNQGVCWTR